MHTANVHLDWPFPGFGLDGAGGRARREELKQMLAALVAMANHRECHVVLIAGALFAQRYVTRSTIQFANELFGAAAPIRFFLLPGRHDPATPTSYYRLFPWAPNVHVFGPGWERVDLDEVGASVYGIGWVQEEGGPSAADLRPVADPARINLVLLHGEFGAADLDRVGADYIALGGRHQHATIFAQNGRPLAQYPGTPESLTWEEHGARGVLVGAVDKTGARLEFVQTGGREAVERSLDLTGARHEQDVINALLAVDIAARRQRHLYRITLTGLVDPYLTLDLPLIAERLASEFHLLRLIDQTMPDYDFERLSRERTARGHFISQMLALQQQALDPATADRVRRALRLGMRAFERGAGR